MVNLDNIRQILNNVRSNYSSRDSYYIQETLSELKQDAIRKKEPNTAKDIWCIEQVLYVQDTYTEAFGLMKVGKYYAAWCKLEKSENAIHSLYPHFQAFWNDFELEFMDKHIHQFQSLFPYKVFFSTGMIVKRKTCSICGKEVLIRGSCDHRVGEIYNGEICYRIIHDAKLLEVSLVGYPKQKSTVVFLSKEGSDKDHYDYTIIRYIAERLQSPFDGWDYEWTTIRHPHSKFNHVARNDRCPCGSGKEYKKCCLNEMGVLRPHLSVSFHEPVPDHLCGIVYTY